MTTTAPAAAQLPAPRFRISRYRRLAWWGSGLACALSVLGLVLCWLNPAIAAPLRPGLDFTGGTQIQLERRCDGVCGPIAAAQVQRRIAALQLPEQAGEERPNLAGTAVQVLDQGARWCCACRISSLIRPLP